MADVTELFHADDAIAVPERIVDILLHVAQAPDADLVDGVNVRHRVYVPESMPVCVFEAVHERGVVDMCVEMEHVEGFFFECADNGKADGMVPAQNDGHGALFQHLLGHRGNVVERVFSVGRNNRRIPDIGDASVLHLVLQVFLVLREVVIPFLAETQRVLPDALGSEPGPAHERRALVGRGAHDCDVGFQLVEVGNDLRPQEGRDPAERPDFRAPVHVLLCHLSILF